MSDREKAMSDRDHGVSICTCAVHCPDGPYHESACCRARCECWCHRNRRNHGGPPCHACGWPQFMCPECEEWTCRCVRHPCAADLED